MALELVIYPADGANSFISLVDANAIILASLDHALWGALVMEDKMRWLMFTYEKFFLLKDFVPPTDLVDSCLPTAQAKTAVHSLVYSLNELKPEQQTRIDEMGPLSIEYFKNEQLDRLSIDDFPETVLPCLELYGVTSANVASGLGSFERTR